MGSVAIAHGCTVSLLTRADLPELADLVSAIEHVDGIVHTHSLEDLEFVFEQPHSDPERNAIVVRQETGNMIAFGWNQVPEPVGTDRSIFMMGGCHPAWRNRGLGSLLIEWLKRRALDWFTENYRDGVEPLSMFATSEARVTSDDRLLLSNGFVLAHRYADMFCRLTSDPSVLLLPEGVTITELTPQLAEKAFLIHDQVRAVPGWEHLSLTDWLARTDERGYMHNSFVALAQGSVVGYVLNSVDDDTRVGITEYLGVDPSRQREGIGRGLLKRSLSAFRDAGLAGARIGVEGSGDMTIDVYRSLGFEVLESLLTYVWTPEG